MRNLVHDHGARTSGVLPNEPCYPQKEMTEKIIGCAIRVHSCMGAGYLEAIYENAMAHEMRKAGLNVERQKTVKVFYDSIEVGEHRADIVVENAVALELKCVESLSDKHVAQVISTLKALKLEVGLLINFSESRVVDGIRRVVLTK